MNNMPHRKGRKRNHERGRESELQKEHFFSQLLLQKAERLEDTERNEPPNTISGGDGKLMDLNPVMFRPASSFRRLGSSRRAS